MKAKATPVRSGSCVLDLRREGTDACSSTISMAADTEVSLSANPSGGDANAGSPGSEAHPAASTARRILMGGAKLATGIVLTVVALGVLGALIYGIIGARNAGLTERRDWPSVEARGLDGATFDLATMWRNGSLRYILNVSPYTASIREARERSSAGRSSFTILYLDKGDFRVASSTLYLNTLTAIVDSTGQPRSLSYQGFTAMSAGVYRRIAGWQISWSFP